MKIILLSLFLMLMPLNIYVFLFSSKHSKRKKIWLSSFIILIINVIIFDALIKTPMDVIDYPFLVLWIDFIQSQNSVFGLMIFLLLFFCSLFVLSLENNHLKQTITVMSIKESLDNLPMGLSYSNKDGVVILSNKLMNQLSYEITQRDLQNNELFWKQILEFKMDDIQSDFPILALQENQTWVFYRHLVNTKHVNGVQITAVNITQLNIVRSESHQKSEEITRLNERLRQYYQNLQQIKMNEERLNTKHELHRELGFLLLSTRRVITHKQDIDNDLLMSKWKQNVHSLRSGVGIEQNSVFEELVQAGKDLGIELIFENELPANRSIREFLKLSILEALNNAARHGDAKELKLSIEYLLEEYLIVLSNDGKLPLNPVVESGGLSVLRNKVHDLNGEMSIEIETAFKIIIKIPHMKEGTDD